eukprot:gene4092-2915_t
MSTKSSQLEAGDLVFVAGDGMQMTGGNVMMRSGASDQGVGGRVMFAAGDSVRGEGGSAMLVGGRGRDGGSLLLAAGDATSRIGGNVHLASGQGVTRGGSVTLDVGRGVGADGSSSRGSINIGDATDARLGGLVRMDGRDVTVLSGGGGSMNFIAVNDRRTGVSGSVSLGSEEASTHSGSVTLRSGNSDAGTAGAVEILAGAGVSTAGDIRVVGGSTESGRGGAVDVRSDGVLSLQSGSLEGGELRLRSGGANAVRIEAGALSDAAETLAGGDVLISSGMGRLAGSVSVRGSDAFGDGAGSIGGSVEIVGGKGAVGGSVSMFSTSKVSIASVLSELDLSDSASLKAPKISLVADAGVALSSSGAGVAIVGRGVNVLSEGDGEGPLLVSTSDSLHSQSISISSGSSSVRSGGISISTGSSHSQSGDITISAGRGQSSSGDIRIASDNSGILGLFGGELMLETAAGGERSSSLQLKTGVGAKSSISVFAGDSVSEKANEVFVSAGKSILSRAPSSLLLNENIVISAGDSGFVSLQSGVGNMQAASGDLRLSTGSSETTSGSIHIAIGSSDKKAGDLYLNGGQGFADAGILSAIGGSSADAIGGKALLRGGRGANGEGPVDIGGGEVFVTSSSGGVSIRSSDSFADAGSISISPGDGLNAGGSLQLRSGSGGRESGSLSVVAGTGGQGGSVHVQSGAGTEVSGDLRFVSASMVDIGTEKTSKSIRVHTSAEEGTSGDIFMKTGDGIVEAGNSISNGGTLQLSSGSGLKGGDVLISAAKGILNGGDVSISAGSSLTGKSGSISLVAGSNEQSQPGLVSIEGGHSPSGIGGEIVVGGDSDFGSVLILGGSSLSREKSSILISSGQALSGSGDGANIALRTADLQGGSAGNIGVFAGAASVGGSVQVVAGDSVNDRSGNVILQSGGLESVLSSGSSVLLRGSTNHISGSAHLTGSSTDTVFTGGNVEISAGSSKTLVLEDLGTHPSKQAGRPQNPEMFPSFLVLLMRLLVQSIFRRVMAFLGALFRFLRE